MKKNLFLVVAPLLLLVSACSVLSFSYNNADIYLKYTINGYATFDEGQKETINKNLEVFMRWHRKEMLNEYVSLLLDIQSNLRAKTSIKADDVARFRNNVRVLYIRTLQPVVRPAASLLGSLNQSQLDELVESLARENKKVREKELGDSLDQQLRIRAEKIVDFIQDLVGDLSEEQLEKIRATSNKLPLARVVYVRAREENQASLIALLKQKKGVEEVEAFLSAWLLTPEINRTTEERSILKDFESAADNLIVSTYAMLTETQRMALLKNIKNYSDTFLQLAAKT